MPTHAALRTLALLMLLPLAARAESPLGHDDLMNGFPPPPDRLVTRGNWLSAPYHNWSLKHVESILPTVAVARGDGPVSPLPQASETLADFTFTDAWQKPRDLAAFLRDQHVDALLVWHDGELLVERYRNGQTAHTRHLMFSVTKSVVGLLAELLIHDGLLDDKRRVEEYLPELAGSAYADATVREVLNMEVGIAFSEIYDDPESDIARYALAAGFQPVPSGVAVPASLYEYLPTLRKSGEHGQDFHYVTANTEVLGWLLARVSGSSVAALFEQRLFQPLGPERDALFLVDPHGKTIAGAGLTITARDMLRLAVMLAREGRHGDAQVVPAAVLKKIAAGGTPRPSLWGNEAGLDNSYLSQWYVHHPSRTFSASGVHGQNVYVDPAADLVVVIQSSYPEADGAFFVINDSFFHALIAHLAR